MHTAFVNWSPAVFCVCIADSLSLTNLGSFLRSKTAPPGTIDVTVLNALLFGLYWKKKNDKVLDIGRSFCVGKLLT